MHVEGSIWEELDFEKNYFKIASWVSSEMRRGLDNIDAYCDFQNPDVKL